MMAIFNFFGSILGYLLWLLYNIFHNYGVAIIFFTIIVKAVDRKSVVLGKECRL